MLNAWTGEDAHPTDHPITDAAADSPLCTLSGIPTVTRLEQPFTAEISSLTRAIEMFAEPTGATALLDGVIPSARANLMLLAVTAVVLAAGALVYRARAADAAENL